MCRTPEAEDEEECVEDEGQSDGASGIHEKVQFWMLKPVLLEPLKNFLLHHKIPWKENEEPL